MEYSNFITLNKNSRGVYDLDTSKGCSSGLNNNIKGCYNDCYAYRIAKRYGLKFNTTFRNFKDRPFATYVNQIDKIDMPFIRIGVSGDPSENWVHLINVLKLISYSNKPIVIITKHWNNLTLKQLNELTRFNLYINTSVSALDKQHLIKNRLNQYNILKDYCKSSLRIVSCDFNINNLTGLYYSDIQKYIFDNNNIIDTVFRPTLNNPYILNNIINITKVNFLNNSCYASVLNKKTYLGYCKSCPVCVVLILNIIK